MASGARSHQAKYHPKATTSLQFSGDIIANLERLKVELRESALRSAAHAGAFVLYNEMLYHVGIKPNATGKLFFAIYHWYDTKQSTPTRKVYAIGPNKRKAPHWWNVEFGHWRYNRWSAQGWMRSKSNRNARGPAAHDLPGALEVPQWVGPSSYIRITWDTKRDEALEKAREQLRKKISETIAGMPA